MLTILGGGPAGLSAALEARRRGHRCRLIEASSRVGGNCTTFAWRDFRYDSGAHRFHAKDPQVTDRITRLLGDELQRVEAPSQICTRRGFVTFPMQAATLPFQMGLGQTIVAGWDYLRRPRSTAPAMNFETLAVRAYGQRLSDLFLLGYSRKLWGRPCRELSPSISGNRLRGLNLSALLPRFGRHTRHLEGAFYYPRTGYGRIADRMAEEIGSEHITTNARVTSVSHDGRRITHVGTNGSEAQGVEAICSTIPLGVLLRLLRPAVDPSVIEVANTLQFRHVVLVALFLDTPSVSDNASLYFPELDVPFTRVVEPRNRSALMAPPGQTSLVAEIPCFETDASWRASDDDVTAQVTAGLASYGLLKPAQVIGAEVRRMPHAYPVLDVGVEDRVRTVLEFLDRFENLSVTGRNGQFVYRHLHDMVRFGSDAVLRLESTGALERRASSRAHGRIAGVAAGSAM